MYGYVKKKKKKKKWKRIGVVMDINFVCAVVGGGGSLQKLNSTRFFVRSKRFCCKKKERSIFLCMRILGRI